MQHKRRNKWLSCMLASCIGLMPLAACSKESSKDKTDRFSYTLSIDAKGQLRVVDRNGKTLPAKRVEGPVEAKKIVRLRTVSILDVEGSHYILIDIGGSLYQIYLPD